MLLTRICKKALNILNDNPSLPVPVALQLARWELQAADERAGKPASDLPLDHVALAEHLAESAHQHADDANENRS